MDGVMAGIEGWRALKPNDRARVLMFLEREIETGSPTGKALKSVRWILEEALVAKVAAPLGS